MIATVTLNPSLDEWVEVPTLRVGVLHRARTFARYPGGKGINVSRVIHELGSRSIAYAFVGGGDGDMLRHALARLGIAGIFVPVRGTTRNNYKILTQRPRALTEVNTPGPRVGPADVRRLEQVLLRHGRRPSCVTLCGSLPPGAPADLYARWIRALRLRGVPVVLDTSGTALRRGVAARPFLIKPNRQEAEELLGRRLRARAALIDAARSLVQRGADVVILSLGGDGALLACAQERAVWWAHPPRVRVDSGVGAGDSLVAGFLVGWLGSARAAANRAARRERFLRALRLGVACGTATVMTPGTQLCHRADVRRLLPRVRIRQV